MVQLQRYSMSMMGKRTLVVFVVVIGSLIFPAHCRHQLQDAKNSITTTVNSTSPDGRKVHVVFCISTWCRFFDKFEGTDCYCCPDQSRKENCHMTMEECRSNCASCNPKCSPPSL
ncbi:unnamed protein product [Urochloa decumbens]|uniref:Embryo surrounding factor 1 brassicaceae domain-containing protein n=1 Tax=Urochloa decumbens TaxID=240449 RepID=A0ABC9AHW9_9POAL